MLFSQIRVLYDSKKEKEKKRVLYTIVGALGFLATLGFLLFKRIVADSF